jgi:hypothetical protein
VWKGMNALGGGWRGYDGRQASWGALRGTLRQPRCVGDEEEGKKRSRRATGGNRTRKEAGAWSPHDHTTYLALAATTSMVLVGRAARGCVLWAGKEGKGERGWW